MRPLLSPPPGPRSMTWSAVAMVSTVLGKGNVTAERVVAGADDMGEILMDLPGCYFWVGGRGSIPRPGSTNQQVMRCSDGDGVGGQITHVALAW